MEIIEKLKQLDKVPMHMPGHKRNIHMSGYLEKLAADLDITEIDGFDDLHCAEGILRESMEKAAALRGADRAFYLVNGATCGILAAVHAAVGRGDKVICMRNCHKSVYNALELSGAEPIFVMPACDEKFGFCLSCDTHDIVNAINENPDAKLVILTNPTYEGAVSDVKTICNAAHKKNIPVLVDAAHGASFGFGCGFPEPAISCGADIAVESLHKTLPSLTQTAVCYLSGNRVPADRISEALGIFETSSPSYLLMASIDSCIGLLEKHGNELFEAWSKNLEWFYEKTKPLKNLHIYNNEKNDFFQFDRSKIVILCSSGTRLIKRLRDMGIECEMASARYVIAMTGLGDTRENFEHLSDALFSLDEEFEKCTGKIFLYPGECERKMLPHRVRNLEKEYVNVNDAEGRICAEYVWAYPPGIPILIPGEEISCSAKEVLNCYEVSGIELKGRIPRKNGKILVIKQDFT